MKYKFIILIISCSKINNNNVYFTSLEKYKILKQYQNSYLGLDIYKNDIKYFFIEYKENIKYNIIEIDNFIYIKGQEDPLIPNLLSKTISAINYINSKYKFDYILRTNLSSVWNIPKLLCLYNEIPKQNFFGGYVNFNSFITGTGIFFSRDLIGKLLEINVNNYNELDDVSISKHMIKNNIKMCGINKMYNYKMNYQILDENVRDINSPHHKNNILEIDDNTYIDDILYFRIRNQSLERDLLVTKKIIKRIYNIEI